MLQTVKDLKIEDELKLSLQQTVRQFSASGTLMQPITQEVERQLQQQISVLGMGSVTQRLAALEARLAAFSGSALPLGSGRNSPSSPENLSLSGSLTAKDLRASTLQLDETLAATDGRFAGDLYVNGIFHVSDLYVPNGVRIDGALHAGSLELQSDAVINGTLTLNGDLNITRNLTFAPGSVLTAYDLIVRNALQVLGPVTIDGLATFLGDVNMRGELRISAKQAGTVIIPAGETGVRVAFGSGGFLTVPVVTASSDDFTPWRLQSRTQSGFVIELARAAKRDIAFTWVAFPTGDGLHAGADAEVPRYGIPFPVDAKGVPISSDRAWNSCIRNQPILTADGSPVLCGGYHDGYVWEHPDLHIRFTYNASVDDPILLIPEEYVVTATGDETDARVLQPPLPAQLLPAGSP